MVYSLGMESSEVDSESVGGGGLHFRLVYSFFTLQMPLRFTQHDVSRSYVTVVDGVFASWVHQLDAHYLFIFQLIALNCHFYKQHIKKFVLFKF